jgi:hypothetical protein
MTCIRCCIPLYKPRCRNKYVMPVYRKAQKPRTPDFSTPGRVDDLAGSARLFHSDKVKKPLPCSSVNPQAKCAPTALWSRLYPACDKQAAAECILAFEGAPAIRECQMRLNAPPRRDWPISYISGSPPKAAMWRRTQSSGHLVEYAPFCAGIAMFFGGNNGKGKERKL